MAGATARRQLYYVEREYVAERTEPSDHERGTPLRAPEFAQAASVAKGRGQ